MWAFGSFTFHFHALEKEMATHSSVLAWRIPGMGEPGGLSSKGSHRVGHNWSDLAAVVAVTSKITRDLYNKYDTTEKVWNIQKLPKCHTETQSEQIPLGKWCR